MKWRIFIVCHDKIIDDYYTNDPRFDADHFCFVNVSSRRLRQEYEFRYKVINLFEQGIYRKLGRAYTESEAIYNIYLNGMHRDCDAIGFIHWDVELKSGASGGYNISDQIDEMIGHSVHISFETHDVVGDYHHRILADPSQPNKYKGKGLNCYDYILNDYNRHFKTQYSIQDVLNKKQINLCSCFLIPCPTFERMMLFVSEILESGKLNIFDTIGLYRKQGVLMERYFGLFLALEKLTHKDLPLYHHSFKKIGIKAHAMNVFHRVLDLFK